MSLIKRIVGIVLVAFGVFWTYIVLFRNIVLTFDELITEPNILVGTVLMPVIVIVAGIYLLTRK